ncbi:MAG: hypothetical protein K6B28_10860 [Lachnospiraceae bacterium]|nr:hypothetical protein [Lachnospiraceae bacterium]
MFFPIFTTVLIVFGLFTIYIRTTNKMITNKKDDLWEKELKANGVRRQPLTDINYIEHDPERLSFIKDEDTDEEEREYINTLMELKDKKIANLSSYTNTDLKMKYGPANLEYLSECDQNYLELVRTLYQFSCYEYNKGEIDKCRQILEYGVSVRTDVKGHYKLLADIYAKDFNFEAIERITKEAEKIESPTRDSVIEMLRTTDYFRADEGSL